MSKPEGSSIEKSQNESLPKTSITLTQVQHLKKHEYIAELRKKGIEVDDNDTWDKLRAELVALVKQKITAAMKVTTRASVAKKLCRVIQKYFFI